MNKASYNEDFVVSFQDVEVQDLTDATTNSIAVGLRLFFGGKEPAWVTPLISDDKAPPYCGDSIRMLAELRKRVKTMSSAKDLNSAASLIVVQNSLCIELNKHTGVFDRNGAPVEVINKHGHVIPAAYPDAERKIDIDHVVEAGFFGLAGYKHGVRREIDLARARELNVPVPAINALNLPKAANRREMLDHTKAMFLQDPAKFDKFIRLTVATTVSKIEKDYKLVLKGNPRVMKVENCDDLYYAISLHREVRGSDTDCREVNSAGYYHGLSSPVIAKTARVVHDILKLGHLIGTTLLEIIRPDKVITQLVLSSLVGMGWSIRVLGSANFAEYKGEAHGVFSFFPFKGKYLKYVPLFEEMPKLVSGQMKYSPDLKNMLDRNMSEARDNFAVQWTYLYVQPDLINRQSVYEEQYTFTASAHAHSGHLIAIKLKSLTSFPFSKFFVRTMMANAMKTVYVYSKIRFFEKDAMRFGCTIWLRQQQLKQIKKIEYEDDNDDMNVMFSHTVLSVRSSDEVEKIEFIYEDDVVNYSNKAGKIADVEKQVSSMEQSLKDPLVDKGIKEKLEEKKALYQKVLTVNKEAFDKVNETMAAQQQSAYRRDVELDTFNHSEVANNIALNILNDDSIDTEELLDPNFIAKKDTK